MGSFIVKFRIPIIVVSILFTVFIGFFMTRLVNDPSGDNVLPEDNTDYQFHKDIEDEFGSLESIMVSITTQDSVYTVDTIRAIDEISQFFLSMQEIQEDNDVVSLTNIDNMIADWGELIIDPLIEEPSAVTKADMDDIRANVQANPLINERLMSADEKSTFVAALFPGELKNDEELVHKTEAFVEKLSESYRDIDFRITGTITTEMKVSEYMDTDFNRLFIVAMILVMIILYLILRDFRLMIMPLLVTVFSIVWTLGLKGMMGSSVTIAETVIPVMLIAIGCADGVHIVTEFFHFYKQGKSAREAVNETMKVLTTPVILTSITTSIGFASLISAPGITFKKMGFFLAIGVMVAMLFSLFFIPAILSFFGTKGSKKKKAARAVEKRSYPFFIGWIFKMAEALKVFNAKLSGFTDTFLHKWGELAFTFRIGITLVTVGIIALAVIGVINVGVEQDMEKYFHETDEVRMSLNHVKDTMGGINELVVVIEGKEDTLKDPAVVQAMDRMQEYAETRHETVTYSYSIADYIKQMNYLLNENDPGFRRIPNEVETVMDTDWVYDEEGNETEVEVEKQVSGKNQIASLLLLYEMGGGDALADMVNDSYTRGVIRMRLKYMDREVLRELIEGLTLFSRENLPVGVNVRFAGYYVNYVVGGIIVNSQIYSLITSLIAIFIVLTLIFRSPLNGFIVLVPTFVAIFFNFAIMWIFRVPLDVATSTIASIGLGVGVDYSIHFFSRFRSYYKETDDYRTAIIKAVEGNARAILSNALAVGIGFMALTLSNFKIVFNMGWMIGLSMFTTALTSLVILPALVALLRPLVNKSNLESGQKKSIPGLEKAFVKG